MKLVIALAALLMAATSALAPAACMRRDVSGTDCHAMQEPDADPAIQQALARACAISCASIIADPPATLLIQTAAADFGAPRAMPPEEFQPELWPPPPRG